MKLLMKFCTLMSESNVENTKHIGRKLKEEYPIWFLLEPLRNLDLIFFKIKHYYIWHYLIVRYLEKFTDSVKVKQWNNNLI